MGLSLGIASTCPSTTPVAYLLACMPAPLLLTIKCTFFRPCSWCAFTLVQHLVQAALFCMLAYNWLTFCVTPALFTNPDFSFLPVKSLSIQQAWSCSQWISSCASVPLPFASFVAVQPGRGAKAALHCQHHHVTTCPAQDYLLALVLQQSA